MTHDVRTKRLRAAGARFNAADVERRRALAELKHALAEVDGRITDDEATAQLTGLASAAVHILKAKSVTAKIDAPSLSP